MFSFYKSDYGTDLIKKFRRKSIIEEIIEDNSINEDIQVNIDDLSKRFKKKKRGRKIKKLAEAVKIVFVGLDLADQMTKPKNRFKLR